MKKKFGNFIPALIISLLYAICGFAFLGGSIFSTYVLYPYLIAVQFLGSGILLYVFAVLIALLSIFNIFVIIWSKLKSEIKVLKLISLIGTGVIFLFFLIGFICFFSGIMFVGFLINLIYVASIFIPFLLKKKA